LICPKCKNEKLDRDICPRCGLSECEALLQTAQSFHQEGNISSAIEFYGRYLRLKPSNTEVSRQKVICLYLEAVKSKKPEWFDQANRALVLELEKDWNWEPGHQYRIDLFSSFGKLKELEEEYLRIQTSGETKRAVCANLLKIIRLTKKFKEENLTFANSAPKTNLSWLRKAWPLLLIPVVLLGLFSLSDSSTSKDPEYFSWAPFIGIILGLLIVILLLVALKLNRQNPKNK
jgi:hypothetical protein